MNYIHGIIDLGLNELSEFTLKNFMINLIKINLPYMTCDRDSNPKRI